MLLFSSLSLVLLCVIILFTLTGACRVLSAATSYQVRSGHALPRLRQATRCPACGMPAVQSKPAASRNELRKRPAANSSGSAKKMKPVGSLFSGTPLANHIQYIWEKKFSQEQRDVVETTVAREEHRSVSSACSGSGMGELAFHAVMDMLNKKAIHVHSCEKDRLALIGFYFHPAPLRK